MISAATIPYGYVTIAGTAPTRRQVFVMSAGGVAGALLLTAVLSAAEKLQGPSLLPFGGAAMEAFIFSFIGGGISLLASLRPAGVKR